MGLYVKIIVCAFMCYNVYILPSEKLLSLKQTALKTIIAHKVRLNPEKLLTIPRDLAEEIEYSCNLPNPLLIVDAKQIGTIKLTCFPPERVRVINGYESETSHLVACIGTSVRDENRRLAIYEVAKQTDYSTDNVSRIIPIISSHSPCEPIINCLSVHPQLPIVAWGSNDGTVSALFLMGKVIKKGAFCVMLHSFPVHAIGFDVETSCIISCDIGSTLCMWPFGSKRPILKIERAHAIIQTNLIQDFPVYINNRNKLPLALMCTESPLFYHVRLLLIALWNLFNASKSDDPFLKQRVTQIEKLLETEEIDTASKNSIAANISLWIQQKQKKEAEDKQPPLWQLLHNLKKQFKK